MIPNQEIKAALQKSFYSWLTNLLCANVHNNPIFPQIDIDDADSFVIAMSDRL